MDLQGKSFSPRFDNFSCLQTKDGTGIVWRGVLDTTLCVKVCHGLATGRWFSAGTPPMELTTMI